MRVGAFFTAGFAAKLLSGSEPGACSISESLAVGAALELALKPRFTLVFSAFKGVLAASDPGELEGVTAAAALGAS